MEQFKRTPRTIIRVLENDVAGLRDPLLVQLQRSGLHSIALLPVLQDEQVNVCFVVASRSRHAFAGRRYRWLYNVGHLLAHAMYRTYAHQEAEQANRAKSEFLSRMSHELRTPMNAILGFGQLMEIDDSLPEEHRDSVGEILRAGNHLLELINEVLDLARIESGRMALALEPVPAASVVEECVRLMAALAEKRSIRISHQCPDGIRMQADRTRLKQALLNLLSNAIKYNREHGSVRIEVKSTGTERVQILVRDTGAGIPEARLAELFQPFNRLGAEESDVEGTGIGLSITRRLVEAMGGSVDAESEVGTGSTFRLELPLAADQAAGCPEIQEIP